MRQPVIHQCPDGHYRRVIYGLGPYIADYPEQVLLAGIVSGWCFRYSSLGCSSPFFDLTVQLIGVQRIQRISMGPGYVGQRHIATRLCQTLALAKLGSRTGLFQR